MVSNMETRILLTLLAVLCCVHHSLQFMPFLSAIGGPLDIQPTSEVPCSMLPSLHLDDRQVTGSRMVDGEEMCVLSSSAIPRSMDELIDGDDSGTAAFASHMKPCDGVLLNKDMCLTQSQNDMIKQYGMLDSYHSGRWKRKALSTMAARWTENIIPYTITNNTFNMAERGLIREAMDDWERGTCLTFRPATPADLDKIHIVSGSGCYSRIGRVGGEQELSLGTGLCRTKKVIMHEIGHAIGLIHEHQRDDRDSMVTIETNNIDSRYLDQFNKISASIIDVTSVNYDYMSLMHYGKSFFSSDGTSTTIRTQDPRYQDVIGRVDQLSFSDYKAVNLMYTCEERCPRKVFCVNGGYVGPNCRCVCPDNSGSCTANSQTLRSDANTTTTAAPTAHTPTEQGEGLEGEIARAPSLRYILRTNGRTLQRSFARQPLSQNHPVQGQGQTNQESRRVGSTVRDVAPSSSSNMPRLLQAILREFPTFAQRLPISNSRQQKVNRGRPPSRRPSTGKRVMIVRRTQGARTREKSPTSRPVVQTNNPSKKTRFMFHIPGSVIKSALREAIKQTVAVRNPSAQSPEVPRRVAQERGHTRSREALDSPSIGQTNMPSYGRYLQASNRMNGRPMPPNLRSATVLDF